MNIYQKSIKAVSDDVDEEVSNVSKYFNDKSEAGRKSVERRNERSSVTLGIITVACMIFFFSYCGNIYKIYPKTNQCTYRKSRENIKGVTSQAKR